MKGEPFHDARPLHPERVNEKSHESPPSIGREDGSEGPSQRDEDEAFGKSPLKRLASNQERDNDAPEGVPTMDVHPRDREEGGE